MADPKFKALRVEAGHPEEVAGARKALGGIVVGEHRQRDGSIIVYFWMNRQQSVLPASAKELNKLLSGVRARKYMGEKRAAILAEREQAASSEE